MRNLVKIEPNTGASSGDEKKKEKEKKKETFDSALLVVAESPDESFELRKGNVFQVLLVTGLNLLGNLSCIKKKVHVSVKVE
jgi:hypothetical protein